jgi:hypothetical protein
MNKNALTYAISIHCHPQYTAINCAEKTGALCRGFDCFAHGKINLKKHTFNGGYNRTESENKNFLEKSGKVVIMK